ncbi:MAG: DNA polymerase III subunit alpha [Bacteroidota bacterium]
MLLNCHTYYSFGYGTYSIKELLTAVYHNGYRIFALTDINNTSAVLETLRLTEGKIVKPVIGIDFRNGVKQQYVGLAKNNEGFKELNEHLTKHLHTSEVFDTVAPEFFHAYIIYPFAGYKGWPLRENEYIGVSVNDLKQLVVSPYKKLTSKLVVLHEVSFAGKKEFSLHRLLRAIDTNTLLSKLAPTEHAKGNEMMIAHDVLSAAYAEYPHILSNTEVLLNSCSVTFEYGKLKSKNKQFYTDSIEHDMALLLSECEKGLEYRYGDTQETEIARERMKKELKVIAGKEFTSYFLINWDIVNYARSRGYYHVGRGSGANSLVAYLIGITDVDPLELDLYFERFINEHRSNAPDFDIDFSWRDREDMTRYIFERFGTDGNVALQGTYSTFQKDAVVQELGKVFGFPPAEIQQLKKLAPRYANMKGYTKGNLTEALFYYAQTLIGKPNHLSIHASGILISEKPITYYSATNLPPKGYATTQFSMIEAEDIGLFKFDILSQRGLGKIKDALTIIKENRGVEIDIHQVKQFKEDEKVKDLLREGKAIGCFYVESPGMRMLLAKLRADDYLRLVAASSIIRPGVSKSGMMREYIDRFRNKELRIKARNKLPQLYDILEETYGVMVYQEDVIKVAHQFADLTLAEADYLRRGMSWKFKQRNEFFKVREQFFKNCLQKGHDEKVVTDIWNQIESFANFAFSKGHSASYAVESYQALYLKAYYPLEYMVATLNNGGGFYRKELYIHEARMHGAIIHVPCVNNSNDDTAINGTDIYLGLEMIAEVTEHTREMILRERKHGLFTSMEDFIDRVPIAIEQMRLLIRVGAFNFTGKNKKELLWQAHAIIQPVRQDDAGNQLFKKQYKSFSLPALTGSALDDAFDEMELLGFSLCPPFELLRDSMPSKLTAKELNEHINKEVSIVGYLVNTKRTYTSKSENMYFGTFVDIEGNWIDTVHFPDSARQFAFTGNGCYHIRGKVTVEYDFLSIEVNYLKRLPYIDRELMTENTHQDLATRSQD